jgi:DNA-binding ferritin-like protein
MVTNLQRSFYESRVASSDVFQKAQVSLKDIVNLEQQLAILNNEKIDPKTDSKEAQEGRAKKLEDANAKLKTARDTLAQRISALGDQKAPYNQFASLLSLSAAASANDKEGIKKQAEGVISSADSSTAGVLSVELAQLAKARIDLDAEATRESALSQLVSLVQSGRFVNAAAASTLAQVSSSDEERARAKSTIEDLLNRLPQQRDLLAQELRDLGIN